MSISKSSEEESEYDAKIREILEDLIFHTIKNRPKNIVSNQPNYHIFK